MTITRETLQRDRERRERDRAELAEDYERAADELEKIGFVEDSKRRRAIARGISLLRAEAERWRR